jgi:hypothetical protein
MMTVVAVFVTRLVEVTVEPTVAMIVVVEVVAGITVVPVRVCMVPEAVVNWVVVEVKAGIVTVLVTVEVVGAPMVVVMVDRTIPGG